jgi:hypothetical protein
VASRQTADVAVDLSVKVFSLAWEAHPRVNIVQANLLTIKLGSFYRIEKVDTLRSVIGTCNARGSERISDIVKE